MMTDDNLREALTGQNLDFLPFEQIVLMRIIQEMNQLQQSERMDVFAIQIGTRDFWVYVEEIDGASVNGFAASGQMYFQSVFTIEFKLESLWERQYESERAKWTQMWSSAGKFLVPFVPESDKDSLRLNEFELRDNWCKYYDVDIISNDDIGRPIYGENLRYAQYSMYYKIANILHNEGILMDEIGKSVPIVFTDNESVVLQFITRLSNPGTLTTDLFRYLSVTQ